jgi:hypothetical protein
VRWIFYKASLEMSETLEASNRQWLAPYLPQTSQIYGERGIVCNCLKKYNSAFFTALPNPKIFKYATAGPI